MVPTLSEPFARDLGASGARFSSSLLAERLIMLAQEADRAGYRRSADRLIAAAHAALDEEAPSDPFAP